MNKQERMKLIRDLIKNEKYQILSGDEQFPTHIRIHDICDVWPTTGTIKLHGKNQFYKASKGVYKLAQLLNKTDKALNVKKGMRDEINHLKTLFESMNEQVKHLTECVEDMQFTLESKI